MLDQAVLEMQQDLTKMRGASREVRATQRMLETRVADAKRDGVSNSWHEGAVKTPPSPSDKTLPVIPSETQAPLQCQSQEGRSLRVPSAREALLQLY